MTPGENIFSAVSALQSAAEKIRRIEDEAREALITRDDPETYRQKLQEKTMLLMELPELVGPFYDGMANDVRAEFEAGLNSFAMRAEQAWELSSIFYMSALLYPEDYREGDRNDLELFIDRLRIKFLS
jgi:DNA polymerase III delta prime subunit